MKRKLLSVLFTLGMIVCLCGASALTSYATDYVASVYNADGTFSQSYETVQAAVNAAANGITSIDNARTVKLLKDVYLTKSIEIKADTDYYTAGKQPQNVIIDLNGHVINGKNITSTSITSVIDNGGNLNIIDSCDKTDENNAHYFNFVKNGVWTFIENPTETVKTSAVTVDNINDETTVVKIYGGVLTGTNNPTLQGPACIISSGNLTINGINIIGNKGGSNASAIQNGSITETTIFTKIINSSIYGNAQACYVIDEGPVNTELIIVDSRIMYNQSTYCLISCIKTKFGGDTVITENKGSYGNSSIYSHYNDIVELGEGEEKNGCPKPGPNMKISIGKLNQYWNSAPGIITINGTEDDVKYFITGDSQYEFVFVKGDKTKDSTDILYNDHIEIDKIKYAQVNFGTEEEPNIVKYATVQGAVDAAAKDITSAENARTVKLIRDVNLTDAIFISGNNYFMDKPQVEVTQYVNIDLNGHILNGSSITGWREEVGGGEWIDYAYSIISNHGTLSIVDNSDKSTVHYFNYVKDGAWTLNTTATEETEAIEVSEITSATQDGTVIKIYGGVITGCMPDTIQEWGDPFSSYAIISTAPLTLKNITIVGNITGEYGNVVSIYTDAETVIDNTLICGNYSNSNTVFCPINKLKIVDSIIKFNKSNEKCAVKASSFTVGGNTEISDNNCKGNNLILLNGGKITLGTGTDTSKGENGCPVPGSNMKLSFMRWDSDDKPTTGRFTVNGNAADVKYFICEYEGKGIAYHKDGYLVITDALEVSMDGYDTVYCDTFVKAMQAISDKGKPKSKIKLLADINLTQSITITNEQDITIDLNDRVLSTKTAAFFNYGTLSIVDGAESKSTRYFTDEKCIHGIAIGEECTSQSSRKCDNGISAADCCFETYYSAANYDTEGKIEGKDYIKAVGGVITGLSAKYTFFILNENNLLINNINIVGNYTKGVIYTYNKESSANIATAVIDGVTIRGNVTSFGHIGEGSVYYESGKVIIGGKTVITDNKFPYINGLATYYADHNLVISNTCQIELGKGKDVNGCSEPDDMKIQIVLHNIPESSFMTTGPFTSNDAKDYSDYFYIESEYLDVLFVKGDKTKEESDVLYNDHLELVEYVASVDFGGDIGVVKYATVQKAINAAAKGITSADNARTVKLLKDIDLTETITVKGDDESTVGIDETQYVILDLNDHILNGNGITSATPIIIDNYGNLSITDNTNDKNKTTRYFTDEKCRHGKTISETCSGCTCPHLINIGNYCPICQCNITAENSGIALKDGCYETYSTEKPGDGTDYIEIKGGVITGFNALEQGMLEYASVRNINYLSIANINFVGNIGVTGCVFNQGVSSGEIIPTVKITNSTFSGNFGGYTSAVLGGKESKSEIYPLIIVDNCIITKNVAGIIGAFASSGRTIIGGATKIRDNKSFVNGKVYNVAYSSDCLIELGDGVNCTLPADGMEIGVSCVSKAIDKFTIEFTKGRITTNGTAADASRFFSDDSKYSVYYVSKGGYLELDTAKIAQVDFGTGIGIKQYSDLQTAIDEASAAYTSEGGAKTVTLIDDVNLTETVTVKGDDETTSDTDETQHVVLDLNGFVLNGDSTSSVITNNGTLTIKDSGTTEHYFKYSANGKWLYIANPEESQKNVADPIYAIDNETTVVKVTGGCITGGIGEIAGDGGAVANKGIFTLESGNIVGNSSANDNTCHGGGVANSNNGSFVMNGGCIIGNYSYHGGGGIFNYAGTVTVNSGSVLFNIAKESGGGIGNDGTLIIEGGLISKNTSGNIGGGIYTSGGRYVNIKDVGQIFIPGSSLTVGGYAKVYDNIGVKGNNLAVFEGNLLNIGTSYDGTDGNEVLKPAYGMCVYVTLLANDTENPTSGAFTTNGSVYDVYYFFSDDGYKVIFNKDHLELSDGIVEITNTTYGIIPENDIDAATAKSRASNSEKTKDLASGIVAYAKVNGQYRCVVKSEGGEWTAVDKLYTFEELKNETNAFVIGMKSDFCYVTTRGIYEGSGLTLYVGEDGKEEKIGIFTIEKQSNGSYYIYETVYEEGTPEKRYLSLDTTTKNETYSSSPSEWKCDSTGLYQEVTKTVKTRILFFYRTKKSTEKVYLTKNGSTAVKVKEVFETHFYRTPQLDSNDEHYKTHHLADCVRCEYSALQQHFFNDNGVCTNCGYEKNKTYAIRGIDVNIETKVVSRKLADIIKGKNKAYTVKVTPYGDEGVYATDVKYKLDIDADWIDGDSFVTYNSEFEVFVSVTDNNGETTEWYYSNKKKK